MVTPAPTITSALQLKRMRKRKERSSWPLPSGILTRNYKCCFCLMTLSQNLGTGPLWAAKGMTLQPVKTILLLRKRGENKYWGTPSSLSATFGTLLYFTVEKLASTFSGSHHPQIIVAQKLLNRKDLLATLKSQGFSAYHLMIYSTTFPLLMLPFPILCRCYYLIHCFHCRA